MSRDILDLIDSTLDDATVSDDAMRWAPDAPDPTPGGKVVAFVRDGLGEPLTPWQEEFVARAADVQRAYVAATRPLIAAVDEFIYAAAAEFALLGEQIRPYFVIVDEIYAAETAKRARLRHLHSEYRRRTRRSMHR